MIRRAARELEVKEGKTHTSYFLLALSLEALVAVADKKLPSDVIY